MPKRKLVAAILAIALGAALGGALVMAAPWTDTQTASGTVTVSSTQDELYICDVTGVTDPRLPPEAPPAPVRMSEELASDPLCSGPPPAPPPPRRFRVARPPLRPAPRLRPPQRMEGGILACSVSCRSCRTPSQA